MPGHSQQSGLMKLHQRDTIGGYMDFIPVTNVARFQIVYLAQQGIVSNTFHCLREAGWDVATLDTVMEENLDTWLRDKWAGTVNNGVEVQRIVGTDLTSGAGAQSIYTPPTPIVGTAPGGSLPRSVTACMNWRTGIVGRSFRGRTFHVGIATTFLNGFNFNLLSTDGRDALIESYEWLRARSMPDGAGGPLVVVSYMENGVFRSTGLATPAISVDTNLAVDTLRPRMYARPT